MGRSGGAGMREHLPLPRRQTFEILYFSTHFKLKRTTKILCLVQPRLQLPLPVSASPSRLVGPSDSRPAAILGAFTSQRGSTRGEEASRAGAPSWDGVNTALNVVFLYYTRSYTVLCAHFSLIILNIL